MNNPKGIRLRRTRGYRKPASAIVVKRGKPSAPWRWGNPFIVGDNGVPDRATAVALFEEWLVSADDPRAQWMRANLHLLRGHDLACSCPIGEPCHRDVLLRLANPPN